MIDIDKAKNEFIEYVKNYDINNGRIKVKMKLYTYKIKLNHKSDAYYFGTFYDLNLNNIKKACKLFLGCHNFQNFVSGKRDNYETYIKSSGDV